MGRGRCRRVVAAVPPLHLAAAILIASTLVLSLLPLSSGAAAKEAPAKRPKGGPSPPPPSAVDVGGITPPSSSAVFRLYGDVYPHGLYYVTMNIGQPPKPYFLDVDTGSDLTWLQCDAPCVKCFKGPHPWYKPAKNKLVPCQDPLCLSLQTSLGGGGGGGGGLQGKEECKDSPQQCDYEIGYADHGSSTGVLVSDAFSIPLTNGSLLRPNLAFGCGYNQQGEETFADGVLGLGGGKSSIVSQLRDAGLIRHVIGHCLSRKGGGYLFLGDGLVPSTGVTWAPMYRSPLQKHYSPGPASLYFGRQSLGVKDMQVVFDSGSSYSYFALQPYQALLTAVKKDLSGKPLKEAYEDRTLPVCWKGPKPFRSILDVKSYYKSLVLNFVKGRKAVFEIPAENYLIITKHGNACLGILNGTEVGLKDLNIIGDVSMQDLMVIYDKERQQIGWVRAGCDRLPKSGTTLVEDESEGFEEVYNQPLFSSMGLPIEVCPASRRLYTVQ